MSKSAQAYFRKWMDEGDYESDDIPVVDLMDDYFKAEMRKVLEGWTDERIDKTLVDPKFSEQYRDYELGQMSGAKTMRDELLKEIG